MIPKYARIKIPYTSPASLITQRKTQLLRVSEEIKFLYMKKDKLNEILYKAHLQAALEWGNCWHLNPVCQIVNTKKIEERKTNLMSLIILFHLLCAQHVSDINIAIFRSLRLC